MRLEANEFWCQVAKQLGSGFVVKDLGVLVDTKLIVTMTKQCAFTAKEASSPLDGDPSPE